MSSNGTIRRAPDSFRWPGGQRVGFSATGKIDRRDFGLTWNQALETGGVVVWNDIKISLEVEAIKVD